MCICFAGPVENKAGNSAITKLSFQIVTRPVCWSAGADSCFSSQLLGKALRSVLRPRTSEVCEDRVHMDHGNCAPVTHVGTEFSWTMAVTHGVSRDPIASCLLSSQWNTQHSVGSLNPSGFHSCLASFPKDSMDTAVNSCSAL